jgi:hypothetical protein
MIGEIFQVGEETKEIQMISGPVFCRLFAVRRRLGLDYCQPDESQKLDTLTGYFYEVISGKNAYALSQMTFPCMCA